jgi:hypothetical protein
MHIASTGSSSFKKFQSLQDKQYVIPPINPITNAAQESTHSGSEVIEISPARIPLQAPLKSKR